MFIASRPAQTSENQTGHGSLPAPLLPCGPGPSFETRRAGHGSNDDQKRQHTHCGTLVLRQESPKLRQQGCRTSDETVKQTARLDINIKDKKSILRPCILVVRSHLGLASRPSQ